MSSLDPARDRLWRSLEARAANPAFVARAAAEFPALAEALKSAVDRRRVIKLMAAAFALGGVAGCDEGAPGGDLIPAVRSPPDIIPGQSNWYATANVVGGFATGVVVRHSMGRPIKVEGNPHHPASLGATDVLAQAAVLDFYDPDRAGALTRGGEPTDEPSLLSMFADLRATTGAAHGEGLRILTGSVTSPTLGAQLDAVLARYPAARWHQWEPVSRDAVRKGAVMAYGRAVDLLLHPGEADVILALDSDLLSSAPGHLAYARAFAARRNPTRTKAMSRVYAIEPTPSLTGVAADHRFVAGPREMHAALSAVAAGVLGGTPDVDAPPWVAGIVADLRAHPGRALVHVGPQQPGEAHALVHAMNEKLGGRDATFDVIDAVEHAPIDQSASLAELMHDIANGRVRALLILDSNPVFTVPGFDELISRVPLSLSLAGSLDETAAAATWFVPMVHAWETWGDARAFDGTATIMQPQALPLYGGISPLTLLGLLLEPAPASPLSQVRAHWRLDDQHWHDALATGVVPNTAQPHAQVTLHATLPALPTPVSQSLTVMFRPDPHLWDGRFANNAWLEELPRPVSKLTWDNPLLISPRLAHDLEVANGHHVKLTAGNASITVPTWIMPGQAADCVVALLGFGRKQVGAVGAGAGFNFYPLTRVAEPFTLERVEGNTRLACTDHHTLLLETEQDIIHRGTLSEFVENPHLFGEPKRVPHLYRWKPPGPAAWAMSIDLNACIGCNACAIACQAENNVPAVGREQVLHEREMHWLRIDRYWQGEPDAPRAFFQPMLCMQCEQAPCEIVCPVGATVHDSEGLNVMVYNRCVGTRFCSNNCPYKVRRFNYFAYGREQHRPPESWNPDVSVRARGVMEKCTFCLQRIAAARIEADRENRPVGEVKTACQAACPTQAITFGNLADLGSDVARRKQSPLDYALLEDQNTVPRVTYEGRIFNPNLALRGDGA